jgi:hypothetical protein
MNAAASPDAKHQAARVLRFLNTPESARQLAKLFWARWQEQGSELMFGLAGSTYPQVAAEAIRAEIPAPNHAISEDFLHTLVLLETDADSNAAVRKNSPSCETWWSRHRTASGSRA